MKGLEIIHQQLFSDISNLIEESRKRLAVSVNSEITKLYWSIGRIIRYEVLNCERAEYGGEVIDRLAQHLTLNYGRGWNNRHLHHCNRFAEVFPEEQIVYTLCTQLSWSHLRIIIAIEDELKRVFYIEMSRLERWSVRQLQERIHSMLYERTVVAKKPEKEIREELDNLKNGQVLSPDLVFRDPYVLDFLGLADTFNEKDLESSIIAELQRFIIELGNDFAFLARQKRITIDRRDYKIDLLFFHRRLKSLVVVELKLGEFEAGYKGQMELYLNWLEKYEMIDGENPPIGLILCTGKNSEHIELMRLHQSNIKVAEYITILPSKEIMLEKFQRAIEIARNKLKKEY